MRKFFGVVFIILGLAALITFRIPAVTQLSSYPTSTLEQEAQGIQIQMDGLSLSNSPLHKEKKSKLQRDILAYKVELARRKFFPAWAAVLFVLVGIALLTVNFVRKKKIISERSSKKVRVNELMPSEIYVDEAEYYRRKTDGFPSKEDALIWYENDPIRVCSYCGSTDVKPTQGQQNAVQLVTFYKKVPPGAKDLRIIWGSAWFVKAATTLECEKCGQRVQR